MPELLIATTNTGKFCQLRDALQPLDLVLKSLSDIPASDHIALAETGQTVQENARLKGLTYARQLNMTVLAMDNGLYLTGLPDELQPGMYVRRIYGDGDYPRPSDQELLAYYTGVVTGLGGQADGWWEFAVCFATPAGQMFETTVIQPRRFVSRPSFRLVPGYPLESLQIDSQTGKYIAEMTNDEKRVFWQALIGERLCKFVREALERFSKEVV